MILLDATYVNTGGGKVLLDYLIKKGKLDHKLMWKKKW